MPTLTVLPGLLPGVVQSLVPAADPAPAGAGFSVTNLLLLLLVVAVGWPAYQWLRRRLSRRRRERWEAEGLVEEDGFTRDNDPDLRRDDTG